MSLSQIERDAASTTHMTSHVYVFQEWDILRVHSDASEERVERTIAPASKTHSYGAQIQEARIRNRLSIADVAQKIGVNARTVSMYENGSEMPNAIVAAQIKALLNLED